MALNPSNGSKLEQMALKGLCMRLEVCDGVFLGCTETWTSQSDTNVFNGQPFAASTLTACQTACINNASCTGIDWDPGNPASRYCWFSGPWSSYRNDNGAVGVTRYDLTRLCAGKH